MSEAPADVDDGFLSRWSRLKRQPESSVLSEPTALFDPSSEQLSSNIAHADALGDEQQLVLNEGEKEAATMEAEPLTDADMPDLDTLDEQSDFSGFFSEKVTEQLRRKALQKLFHLPAFNIRDGLNEYDHDYSSLAPLGDTLTYQMKQFVERQKQQFKDALQDDPVEAVAVEAPADPDAEPHCSRQEPHPEQEQGHDEEALGTCE